MHCMYMCKSGWRKREKGWIEEEREGMDGGRERRDGWRKREKGWMEEEREGMEGGRERRDGWRKREKGWMEEEREDKISPAQCFYCTHTVFHTRRIKWPLFHILSHISKTLQVYLSVCPSARLSVCTSQCPH